MCFFIRSYSYSFITSFIQLLANLINRFDNYLNLHFCLIFSASVEIEKVRKSKEVDLAGLQAALKKANMKMTSLETALEQKVC